MSKVTLDGTHSIKHRAHIEPDEAPAHRPSAKRAPAAQNVVHGSRRVAAHANKTREVLEHNLATQGTHRLSKGAHGPTVVAMQKQLAALGYPVGPIDGKFGPITDAAVRMYQRDHGLKVDGWAGPKTMASLALSKNGTVAAGKTAPTTAPTTAPPVAAAPETGPVAGSSDAAPGVAGMLDWAKSKIGTPYAAANPFRFGDVPWDGKPHTSNNGSGTVFNFPAGTQVFDCSGFVVAAFRQRGVDLAAHGLASSGAFDNDTKFLQPLTKDELKPGDLIIYNKHNGVGHVVIYLGDGKCIDAAGKGGVGVHDVDWGRAKSYRRVPVPDGA